MADEIVFELDGTAYRWDGSSWYCLSDDTAAPSGAAARLNALLAKAREGSEADQFTRAVGEAMALQRPLRVLVTGSRAWEDVEPIRRELAHLPVSSVIIHGGAAGADRLAGQVAAERGLTVIACPAEWKRYGRGAGLVRNRRMLEEHQPDVIIAFHPCLEQARGTKHMVEIARKAKVPVRVVSH